RDLAGLGHSRADHAHPVRRGLCHRVHDGHLLHQPADRARPAAAGNRRKRSAAEPAHCGGEKYRPRSVRRRIRRPMMEWYLPVIWAALIGTAVALYVCLDGFDLGIGILFATSKSEAERDQMMRSIAPFWDGNETWLVLGGAGLFVAFPNAYAV